MTDNLMILPADKDENIRLIRIPDDLEKHEAYRHVTGIIASVEENSKYDWEDIQDLLEDRGFDIVDFALGPSLD